ncbi:MAG: hypothetical protein KME20_26605 [Kaiparowitsia implicata GSE-PSE-MK54-09C]|nr:hypothetical protein [Kaiparowitsia implicata GSE-PSE-MK54-09C]
MKHFIATYDIEAAPGDPHRRFLEAALARGWRATLGGAGQFERLPSNTLLGEFSDLDRAHQTFEIAIADASAVMSPAKINVERRYIVERVPAGRLKATKRQWVKTNIARLNTLLRPKSST